MSRGRSVEAEASAVVLARIDQTAKRIRALVDERPTHLVAGWGENRWERWSASEASQALLLPGDELLAHLDRIRIGSLKERATEHRDAFTLPAFAPFLGQDRTVVLRSGAEGASRALALLQSLVLRTAISFPHQASFVLLDPSGQGRAFPMRGSLPHVLEDTGDVRRDLDEVLSEIKGVYTHFLDVATRAFDEVRPDLRITRKFRFVFAAGFPFQYDRRAIEALFDVCRSGGDAGTYVFIQHDTSRSLPSGLSVDELDNAFVVDLDAGEGHTPLELVLETDGESHGGDHGIDVGVYRRLFSALRQVERPDTAIPFEELPPDQWWTSSAEERIETPVGSAAGLGHLRVALGELEDGRICAHGLMGGMTGSGKSNFYHVFILGLCQRYSPDELQLYLVDGKDGVELRPYRNLPHARVVSLHTLPELSRSILAELIDEMEYRNTVLFQQAGSEINDYASYRVHCDRVIGEGGEATHIPRLLLLIDEYQELFEGDRDGVASRQLLQLSRQGRSAGIHLFLGGQRFGDPGLLYQSAVFGNFHLRLALQMTQSDSQALHEFGREGRKLIAGCTSPGQIVINDRSGDDEGNRTGKVSFLSSDELGTGKEQLVERLYHKARDAGVAFETLLFDGHEPPGLLGNPQVRDLVERESWPSTAELEAKARRDVARGGYGVDDWQASEAPGIAWLGQELDVRGQARVVLRRRAGENLALVGSRSDVRVGMTVALAASLALCRAPETVELEIVARSGSTVTGVAPMELLASELFQAAGHPVRVSRSDQELDALLEASCREIDRRRVMTADELAAVPLRVLLLWEVDRLEALRLPRDVYGMDDTERGSRLLQVLNEGPALGLHGVATASSVRGLCRVIGARDGLPTVRHRVALQMSEDASFAYLGSRQGSVLQVHGDVPVRALYQDMELHRSTSFKPYSTRSPGFELDLALIGDRLTSRRAVEGAS